MTMIAAELIPATLETRCLLIADHGSNRVPPGIDLGVPAAVMGNHIAIDIGVDPLVRALAARLGMAACLATASRLVVDLNRDPDAPGAIPTVSDGITIPGNQSLDTGARAGRLDLHDAYHAALADAAAEVGLLVSIHSFTPALSSRPEEARPWPIGILYNRDDRAARAALDWLAAASILAGDNQPYSGRDLNYTMDRHGEAAGRAYLSIEMRQDEIGDAAGRERWLPVLADLIVHVRDRLLGA